MENVAVVGLSAPDFTLPDLEGVYHSLADYRRKILVVNFWAETCPWVERVDRLAMPCLKTWGESVAWLSIAVDPEEPLDDIRRAVADRGLPVMLRDTHQAIARLYGAQITPHLFVIDREGTLRYQGAFDDVSFRQRKPTRSYLVEVIDELLAGRQPAITSMPPYGCAITIY